MGNTLDGYVYRLNNNDPDLTEIRCLEEGVLDIGDEGATEFACALAQNRTLKLLDLNCQNIGDEGAGTLASAILLNGTLSVIRLHRNHISDEGARKLAAALRHNHIITTLYMSSMNAIRDGSIDEEIQQLVEMNKEGPQEAARQKAELFGSGWVAEGATLKRSAAKEISEYAVNVGETSSSGDTPQRRQAAVQSKPNGEYEPLIATPRTIGWGKAHEKKD